MDDAPARSGSSYRERLRVPVGWWALGAGMVASLALAVWAVYDARWALGATLVAGLVVAGLLVALGWHRLVVDDRGLRAGDAVVEWAWVAGAEALDADQTRTALAAAADGRTWLFVRPWLRRAVRVELDDPADPHRDWLVGSRHPQDLAAAVRARLGHAEGRR